MQPQRTLDNLRPGARPPHDREADEDEASEASRTLAQCLGVVSSRARANNGPIAREELLEDEPYGRAKLIDEVTAGAIELIGWSRRIECDARHAY